MTNMSDIQSTLNTFNPIKLKNSKAHTENFSIGMYFTYSSKPLWAVFQVCQVTWVYIDQQCVSARMWRSWIKHQKWDKAPFSIKSFKRSDWKDIKICHEAESGWSENWFYMNVIFGLVPSIFLLLKVALQHKSCARLNPCEKYGKRVGELFISLLYAHNTWPSMLWFL